MRITTCRSAAVALVLAALAAPSALANNYGLTWLNFAPVPFNTSVPNNSVYNLPGVGPVTVNYSFSGPVTDARVGNPLLTSGSVTSGPDTYSWTNHESFGVVPSGPNLLTGWRITFTFPTTQAANTIYLGVSGLGRTTSFGGGQTLAQCAQNGTFLGDWTGGGNYGPTQFTGGVGSFSMINSLTGAGGADPWWNTPLAVVQINDAVSSITVNFENLRGDGVGVNIAVVPTPGAAALLGLGGLAAVRRRRR
jgi:MYXO-CTERM domain-containing protein